MNLLVAFVLGTLFGAGLVALVSAAAERAAHRRWQAVVAAQSAATGEVVERAVYGGRPRREAESTPGELTLEEEAQRAVSEETIQRGMAELREAYHARGLQVDDAELRSEVVMAAMGIDPFGAADR